MPVHQWAVSNAAQKTSVAGIGICIYHLYFTRTKSIVLIGKKSFNIPDLLSSTMRLFLLFLLLLLLFSEYSRNETILSRH